MIRLLGDIADKRFRLLRSRLPFRGLSVCLSICHICALCSKGRCHDFFCILQPTSLHNRVKIWLTLVKPFLPRFCSDAPINSWLECQRHSMANCSRMVRDSATVTMERL